MKILIVSDIHGSGYYAEKLEQIVQEEKPEKIIILGDLYYHGPRNDLSQEYNPMKVAGILNQMKEKLIVIRGNCDAEVDETISEFPFNETINEKMNGKKVFISHGHKFNKEKLPPIGIDFDIMFYGHFHIGFIEKENGIIFANPGSISLPRNNSEHSYIIFNDNEIILKDVNGKIIKEEKI